MQENSAGSGPRFMAHLSNSSIFGSAGGRLVFDVNDFDETLPNPARKTPAPAPLTDELCGRVPRPDPDVRQS